VTPVSSAKFAAITASLLTRKGDAAPSVVVPVTAPPRPALVARGDQPFPSEPRQPDNAEKLRRIVVSITQEELVLFRHGTLNLRGRLTFVFCLCRKPGFGNIGR
jgi:hypothetical protein